ncbi:hypothetical protein JTB14_001958 [Gonioctena quinquepunctata]|nr:hypothetical protein JTB14_001958 [Gonioctena quinquepunctata]
MSISIHLMIQIIYLKIKFEARRKNKTQIRKKKTQKPPGRTQDITPQGKNNNQRTDMPPPSILTKAGTNESARRILADSKANLKHDYFTKFAAGSLVIQTSILEDIIYSQKILNSIRTLLIRKKTNFIIKGLDTSPELQDIKQELEKNMATKCMNCSK